MNDYNYHFPKTIVVEKNVYEDHHNGNWVDVWQFDLAQHEGGYNPEVLNGGEHFWKKNY
jgi:hypothetical protein